MELTKEDFEQILDKKLSKLVTEQVLDEKLNKFATVQVLDQKLSKFATKDDLKSFATKEDLQKALSVSEGKIIARIDEAQEELARMTKDSFDDVMGRIKEVDIRPKVEKLEKQMTEPKGALRLS